MKVLTSLLVNRLLILIFTSIFILSVTKANASLDYNTTGNPGVEYASLAASANEKGVFINWVTLSEQNNSHFEVERSSDMKSFKTVAMVLDGFAAPGTNGKAYKFKEAAGEVRKGKTVYYRLKQIDTNNQVHYSTVMAVQMNEIVTVFPKQQSSINKEYTNKKKLLSKQSTSNMGKTQIPAVGSTTGILSAHEIISASERYNAALKFA